MDHNGEVAYAIRSPYLTEVKTMLGLFEDEVKVGRMLPRKLDEVEANLDNWLVAVRDEHIIGCASLVFFPDKLCEIRSLAVHAEYRSNGLGSALVEAALGLATRREVNKVLTMTRSAQLFERLGFKRDLIANYPSKVWQDCHPCPFNRCCDEIAMVIDLYDKEEVKSRYA